MIKSNEVRINNLLQCNGVYCRVRNIDNCIAVAGRDKHFFSHDGDLQGIPLTPEILEKCGFVFKSGDSDNDWYFKNIKHIVLSADESTGFNTVFVSCGAYAITEITYLHQLQNLFFSLTGEELNVKI